jgi:hypothetical protein
MTSTAHRAPTPDYSIGPAARPRRDQEGPAGRRGRPALLPAAAGLTYVAACITGLSAWPSNLPLNATAAQSAAGYAAHPAAASVQYLLVEGLAGLLLAAVLGYALVPRLRNGGPGRARLAAVLGAAAAAISVAQCVLGLVVVSAATGHHVARAGELANLANQLDGGKMLALAGTAAALATLAAPGLALPRWLRAVSVPLAVSLIASGCAYLALWQPLAWTPYVSGPFLLVWVAGLGISTSRQRARSGR